MKEAQKRVTIKDVAKLADVSIATVSKVLNGKDELVSYKTRVQVRTSADQLGYIPNDMAKRLKESSSKTIGMVLPDFSNAFPEMIQGADDEASWRGYNIFLCNTNGNAIQEEKQIKMLISKMVDGIIYVSSNFESGEKIISGLYIPCVSIDRKIQSGDNIGFVGIDNYTAMKEAGVYLVKNGCKRIGYVTTDISKSPCDERLEGLCSGL